MRGRPQSQATGSSPLARSIPWRRAGGRTSTMSWREGSRASSSTPNIRISPWTTRGCSPSTNTRFPRDSSFFGTRVTIPSVRRLTGAVPADSPPLRTGSTARKWWSRTSAGRNSGWRRRSSSPARMSIWTLPWRRSIAPRIFSSSSSKSTARRRSSLPPIPRGATRRRRRR